MKKINQFVQIYLKWTSPIALLAATLSGLGLSGDSLFFDFLGITTILWILLLIYAVFRTSLSPEPREKFVRWLSGIKENDERESQITGHVSKSTFIFMTGLLLLMLFMSVIRIDIYRNKDLIAQGKNGGMVELGAAMRFIESSDRSANESNRDYIIKYHGLPLTADGTLALVLVLQVGAFYFFSRKTGLVTSS